MTPASGPVPRPCLQEVVNRTPFVDFACDKMGPGRRFFDTVVLKATLRLVGGRLGVADRQAPITLADEPFSVDDAPRSSLRRAGEVVLFKPATDVIVTGTARTPDGSAQREWDVAVAVRGSGPELSYSAQVTGPRALRHHPLGGWKLSAPGATAEVPVRYELAYGGGYPDANRPDDEDAWQIHEANPSGRGFVDEESLDRDLAYPAPQWQSRLRPFKKFNAAIPVAGLAPMARPWACRLAHAGTYDEAWMRRAREDGARGLPLDYPADFDARFFQVANPELVAKGYLRGDESLGLAGLVAGHDEFVTRLPSLRIKARLRGRSGGAVDATPALDTLHVDLDAAEVYLCWRLTIDQRVGVRSVTLTHEESP